MRWFLTGAGGPSVFRFLLSVTWMARRFVCTMLLCYLIFSQFAWRWGLVSWASSVETVPLVGRRAGCHEAGTFAHGLR